MRIQEIAFPVVFIFGLAAGACGEPVDPPAYGVYSLLAVAGQTTVVTSSTVGPLPVGKAVLFRSAVSGPGAAPDFASSVEPVLCSGNVIDGAVSPVPDGGSYRFSGLGEISVALSPLVPEAGMFPVPGTVECVRNAMGAYDCPASLAPPLIFIGNPAEDWIVDQTNATLSMDGGANLGAFETAPLAVPPAVSAATPLDMVNPNDITIGWNEVAASLVFIEVLGIRQSTGEVSQIFCLVPSISKPRRSRLRWPDSCLHRAHSR